MLLNAKNNNARSDVLRNINNSKKEYTNAADVAKEF